MKTLIVALGIGFICIASSCGAPETPTPIVQLTTGQMLLLGTTDPSNITATATYRLDSAFTLPSDSSVQLGSSVYTEKYTKDSISDFIDGTLWQTSSYSVQNDSIFYLYGDDSCNHKRLFTITSAQLKVKYFDPNPSGCQEAELVFFTKQ